MTIQERFLKQYSFREKIIGTDNMSSFPIEILINNTTGNPANAGELIVFFNRILQDLKEEIEGMKVQEGLENMFSPSTHNKALEDVINLIQKKYE